MIVLRFVKIDETQPLREQLTGTIPVRYFHAVTYEVVFVPVDGQGRLGRRDGRHQPHGLFVGRIGETRIEPRQLLPQIPGEHDFLSGAAAQRSVGSQHLVKRVYRLPSELVFQVIGRRSLNKIVFGVCAHTAISPFMRRGSSKSRAWASLRFWRANFSNWFMIGLTISPNRSRMDTGGR